MKFFFHRWLNFSFDSFLSTFNMCIQLRNVNEIFQSIIMKVFQKKEFLPDIWSKVFLLKYISPIKDQISIENDGNDRCEVNTKEEMNGNLKTYVEKKTEKNENSKADYKKKTRKLWKWIVIGGYFFIINKIINWVTSQFLNINFKSRSRTPALSKVEFTETGAAITMFLVKLVFLLSLINTAHSLNCFGKSLKSNCEEELCFSLGFYPNR